LNEYVKEAKLMLKRLSIIIACIFILLAFSACERDDSEDISTTGADTTNVSAEDSTADADTTDSSEKAELLPDETGRVFSTENVVRITLLGPYSRGEKRFDVSKEYMPAIKAWLDSFTVGEKAPEFPPPGTNSYYVEIEYADATVIKNGLDLIKIDGVSYVLNSDSKPDCFYKIINPLSSDQI